MRDYHIKYETNDFDRGSSWIILVRSSLFPNLWIECKAWQIDYDQNNATAATNSLCSTVRGTIPVSVTATATVQYNMHHSTGQHLQYSTVSVIVQYGTVLLQCSCSCSHSFNCSYSMVAVAYSRAAFAREKDLLRTIRMDTNGRCLVRAWRVQMEYRKVYANAALTSTILIKTVAVWHCTFSSMFSCFCSKMTYFWLQNFVMSAVKCRAHLPPPKKMINLTCCLKHLFEPNLTGSPTGCTYILQYYISL